MKYQQTIDRKKSFMLKLPFKEIEKGTYHSYAKQFIEECGVFERPPRKKFALKFADYFGLDPWPIWEIVKQVLEDKKN